MFRNKCNVSPMCTDIQLGSCPNFRKKKNHYWSVMHISTIVVTVELHKDQIHTCALKCMKLVVYSNNSWEFVINYISTLFTKTKNTTTTTNWENQTNRSFRSDLCNNESLRLLAFYYHEAQTSKFVLRQRLKGISTSVCACKCQ